MVQVWSIFIAGAPIQIAAGAVFVILIALVAAMWLFRDKILNAYYTIKTQRSLIRSSNK